MMAHRFRKFLLVFVYIVGLLIFLMACHLAEEIRPTASSPDTNLPVALTNTPALGAGDKEAAADTTGMLGLFLPYVASDSEHATLINPPVSEPTTPIKTPVPEPAPLTHTAIPGATRFAVIGDYGLAGKPEADVADLVKSWNPEFIITTGDNNYKVGAAETIDKNIGKYYQEFIHPYKGKYGPGAEVNRFFPSMGNHDWSTDGGQPYFDYFDLPGNERYYEFVWGPMHLFAVSSDRREPDGLTPKSVQGQWLKSRMMASSANWKIVYMHHPPYSSSDRGSTDRMQWPFERWGATAVISGHEHVYERLDIDGISYFINGLGGAPIYDFSEPIPGSQVRFQDDYGAMLVEATSKQITFQFITRQNQIIDIVTIYP
jgi:hypothetical protein